MGKGRKIEDWFDRRIAQTRDLDKLPGEMKKSVSSVSSKIKFPANVFESDDHEQPITETVPKAKAPSIKHVKEVNFGERLSKLKNKMPLPDLKGHLREKRADIAESKDADPKYDKIKTGAIADVIVDNPIPALGLMVLLTLFFFFQALTINMDDFPMPFDNNLNIHGETTVYLPQSHETSVILKEVREYWSTDIIIIFIQINDPENNKVNITSPSVLREFDYVEETMDPNKSDRGSEDDIIYCFSISTLIKEVNSTSPRLYNATIKNLADFARQTSGLPVEDEIFRQFVNIDPVGTYDIPSSQNQIDTIVNNLPKNVVDKIARDTNDDGIWDTGIILMGVVEELGDNPKPIIARSEAVVAERPTTGETTSFTVTGTLPLTDWATDTAFYYYGILMPLAITFLVLAILYFHRSMKAVFIAGIPTGASVVWIYGILAIQNTIVTPTIIILGPVLLALGMSYGMHIANRFAQETQGSFTDRARITLKTTGNAVFMSAVTTMIGFISLAFGDLIPVTTVGWALTGGILFCFILTYVMAPCLCILTKYEKKTIESQGATWSKIAKIPTNHSKKVLAFFLVIVLFSASLFPLIERDTNLMDFAPDRDTNYWGTEIEGFAKIDVMTTYSDEFNSGALGMNVIQGTLRSDDYSDDSEDPVANLKYIERMEDGINAIPDEHPDLPVNAIGIISIMRSIGAEGSIGTGNIPIIGPILGDDNITFSQNNNFWAILNSPAVSSNKPLQKFLLNVFWDTISDEAKGMVINEFEKGKPGYYRKTLIYVDMPVLSDKQGHEAVALVNGQTNPEKDGPLYYPHGEDIKATKLTGVAAIAVATNDMLMEQQKSSLVLSIVLVLIVLCIIFRDPKLGILTTIPVLMILGFEPIVMIALGVPLNLATVMIGSSIIGAGVDFSVHITQRMNERGINRLAIKNSVEKAGPALFEATIITLAGLCSAFFVPLPAVYNFILVIMILLLLSAVAAILILPSIFMQYAIYLETRQALKEFEGPESPGEYDDVEWDVS
jgi:predicted RND superfamily exporter protein